MTDNSSDEEDAMLAVAVHELSKREPRFWVHNISPSVYKRTGSDVVWQKNGWAAPKFPPPQMGKKSRFTR